jgi:hypothetical protein
MNYCNCPNCQTVNCPNATPEPETNEDQTALTVVPAANCSPELFGWLQLQADKWLNTAESKGHRHADYTDLRRMSWAFRFVSEEISKENDPALAPCESATTKTH